MKVAGGRVVAGRIMKQMLGIVAFSALTVAGASAARAADTAQTSPVVMSGTAGEWGYRCVFPPNNPAKGPQFCLMQQSLMMQGEGGKAEPLGAVIMARATEDVDKEPIAKRPWRVTAMVPLALSLKTDARIAVEGQSPIRLQWQSCISTGCMASADMSSAQADQFAGGKTGHIMVDKMSAGTLTINFALDGADAAMKQIDGWIQHSPFRH